MALALVTVVPFLHMLVLSLKPVEALLLHPGVAVGVGQGTHPRHYRSVLEPLSASGQGFLRMLLDSAAVALGTVALPLAAAVPGACAVARLRFFGSRQVSAVLLAVYLFPGHAARGAAVRDVRTDGALREPGGAGRRVRGADGPVSLRMEKNYFVTVPTGVEEAAAPDGCSRLQTVRRVVLTLSLPSLMASGLHMFVIAWNEFLFALLFLAVAPGKWTVPLGLQQLGGGIEVPKTVLMAGSVVLTLPVVLLFHAAQRLLTEGLTSGAEKA